jgi:hypothetical protein
LDGTPSKSGLDLDTKLMSDFIYSLNIARRQVQSYPSGHPVIAQAAEKLLGILPKLLEFRPDITLGIARDTLMVGGKALDNTNPIYRDFATNLFDAKVASLTIDKNLSSPDICKFFEILRYKPETIADRGGLDRVLADADIKGIVARGVDFGAFHATEVDKVHAPKLKLIEEETTVLWKSFVNGLVAGTLDPTGDKLTPEIQLDPELLAEIMNNGGGNAGNNLVRNYEEAITSFLKETDRSQLQSLACQETMGRLGNLVSSLKPELRRRFLNSTLKSCSKHHEVASEFLGHLPKAQILEAMEQVDVERLEVPQSLMDVLGKLAAQKGSDTGGGRVAGKQVRSSAETASLLGQLFSADYADEFVPEDYQDALAILVAAENLPGLNSNQIKNLVETLEGHAVEQQFCNVMVDLLDRGTNTTTTRAICRNMEEMIFYFLETGDFVALISIHDHLSRHAQYIEPCLDSPDESALRIFSSDDFIDHVLDGLDTWGKPKYAAIMQLIKKVGIVFVEPLLKRLAEEPNMSKRRLFMECLQVIGPAARESIIAHLHDQRWYFVRNLVILLRMMNDPTVLQPLGHLVGYANANVQFEVMRTFIHFNDPRADRYLLKELDSNDPGILINVARLAANSRSPEVARKLSEILNRKLLKESDENIKGAVIKTLAEMAMAVALPEMERFLLTRNLLQSIQGNSLKIEAVRSLTRYSDPAALALAEKVRHKSSGELARVAGQVYQQLKGKLS